MFISWHECNWKWSAWHTRLHLKLSWQFNIESKGFRIPWMKMAIFLPVFPCFLPEMPNFLALVMTFSKRQKITKFKHFWELSLWYVNNLACIDCGYAQIAFFKWKIRNECQHKWTQIQHKTRRSFQRFIIPHFKWTCCEKKNPQPTKIITFPELC